MNKAKGQEDVWPVGAREKTLPGSMVSPGDRGSRRGFLSKRFTIMLVPHDDGVPFRFQINAFLLGFLLIGLMVVSGGFLFLSVMYAGTEQNSVEKSLALSETQANLDSVLDEVKELVKVHQVFQSSLSTTLKELDIKNEGIEGLPVAKGDLAKLVDVQELAGDEVRDLVDIRRLSSSLSSAVQPLSEIGDVLKAQKRLLSDIPNYWPVGGSGGIITMEFGPNIHPFTNMWYIHKGIDIAGPIGLPILAAANGKVVEASYDRASGYGLTILIEHKYGFRTKYTHLASIHVQPGQTVYQGQRIGLMGNTGISTGSHTHFELQLGTQVLDPTSFLKIHSTFSRWEGNR